MHESALARAALPAPVRCLGKDLRPYSIGHELWLTRENCSILRGAVDGLPTAVLICSRTWDQLKTLDTERWLNLDLKLWRWRIKRLSRHGLHRFSRIGTKSNPCESVKSVSQNPCASVQSVSYLDQELAKFIQYRNDGLLEFPPSDIIDPERPAARMPGAPFMLRLQQWLMGPPCRLSESAAWDYPVGLAKMRWATHWESEGGFKIQNAAEAEFDAFIAKQAVGKG